jgi:hypothetical protein
VSLASSEYLALAERSTAELERVMVRGGTPDPAEIAGFEYRGLNIAFWAPRSPIQKFVKGFYQGEGREAGLVMGYNEPVVQNGPENPWIAKPSDEDPKRFGFYRVGAVDPAARDNAYLHAILLDYGKGGNFVLDPAARLRDYLVQVDPGSNERLLGKAYLAIGPARFSSNYFLLERHKLTTWVRP